jgi:hypothetical protein
VKTAAVDNPIDAQILRDIQHFATETTLRSEQVPEVRRWLRNYQNLKETVEAICELNQELLRADRDASRARSKSRE